MNMPAADAPAAAGTFGAAGDGPTERDRFLDVDVVNALRICCDGAAFCALLAPAAPLPCAALLAAASRIDSRACAAYLAAKSS